MTLPDSIVLSCRTPPRVTPVSVEDVKLKSNMTTLFTKEWVEEFGRDALSCTGPAEDAYVWREAGHGSNFNCESIVLRARLQMFTHHKEGTLSGNPDSLA